MSNIEKVEKKEPRKNYTEREKCLLLDIIEKYKHIIENKTTNAAWTNEKNAAWEKVTLEFNASSDSPRTAKQLTTAYLNLKRVTRQNIANENIKKYTDQKLLKQLKKDETADKKDILATGGGTFKPRLTEVGAQMLGLIGNQIQPLPNSCDSASSYFTCATQDVEVEVNDYTEMDNRDVSINECSTVVYTVDNLPSTSAVPSTYAVPSTSAVPSTYDVPSTSAVSCISAGPPTNAMRCNTKKRGHLKEKIKKLGSESLKRLFYKKKLECAVIEKSGKLFEKRSKLINLQNELKKQELLDLELKIKKIEYAKLNSQNAEN
uniref:Regulatory protein zeste n=1 Tax=Diabrotica virgifera virgifera TaxID=50390 RepID=A0A6P7GMB6_DIAVI